MEMQEKRIFLEHYLRVDRRIDRLCEIQSIWRACAIRIQGMTGQALRHYRAMDEEINRQIDELLAVKQEAVDAIKTVPDRRLQIVLGRRYLLGETWKELAAYLQTTQQEAIQLHEQALAQVQLSEVQKRAAVRDFKELKFGFGGEDYFRREHYTVSGGDRRPECPSCGVQGGGPPHHTTAPNAQ